jgi:hypothetical protein
MVCRSTGLSWYQSNREHKRVDGVHRGSALSHVATGESRRAVYEEGIEHFAACSSRGGSAQFPQEAVVRKFLSE